jgi:hypothetical protein
MRPRCNTQPASGQKGNRSPLQGTGSKVIHYPYLSARISGPTNPTAMDHTGNLDGPRGLRRSTHTTIICARPGEHQRRQTTDPTARTCERTRETPPAAVWSDSDRPLPAATTHPYWLAAGIGGGWARTAATRRQRQSPGINSHPQFLTLSLRRRTPVPGARSRQFEDSPGFFLSPAGIPSIAAWNSVSPKGLCRYGKLWSLRYFRHPTLNRQAIL